MGRNRSAIPTTATALRSASWRFLPPRAEPSCGDGSGQFALPGQDAVVPECEAIPVDGSAYVERCRRMARVQGSALGTRGASIIGIRSEKGVGSTSDRE